MWILLVQISSVSEAIKDLLVKKSSQKFDSPIIFSWSWVLFSTLIFLPIVLILGIPSFDVGFVWILIIRILVDFFAFLFFASAYKYTDISLAVPMLSFSTLVATLASIPINGELPNIFGFGGVLLVLVGTYFLGASKLDKKSEKYDLFSPIKSLYRNKGVMFAFITAILFGINATLSKLSLSYFENPQELSANIFLIFAEYFFVAILMTLLMLSKISSKDRQLLKLPKNYLLLVPQGFLVGLSLLMKVYALNFTLTGFVSASARTSIIFSAILAGIFFKEEVKSRIIPILLMLAGIFMIVLLG